MNEFLEAAIILLVTYLLLRWFFTAFLPQGLHNWLSARARSEEEDRISRKKADGKLPKDY